MGEFKVDTYNTDTYTRDLKAGSSGNIQVNVIAEGVSEPIKRELNEQLESFTQMLYVIMNEHIFGPQSKQLYNIERIGD
ncbi:MAG: hypothetical protein VZQ83_02100 [Eubacterium sp.]|nr:hypothetical protein [Eubacterium sp.]